jgi:hypothetical protein
MQLDCNRKKRNYENITKSEIISNVKPDFDVSLPLQGRL